MTRPSKRFPPHDQFQRPARGQANTCMRAAIRTEVQPPAGLCCVQSAEPCGSRPSLRHRMEHGLVVTVRWSGTVREH